MEGKYIHPCFGQKILVEHLDAQNPAQRGGEFRFSSHQGYDMYDDWKKLNVNMRRFLGGCMSWNKFTPGKNIKIINLLGANYPTAILR